jgi:dTDP-4-amino-4,6-dideoxygalactose transaminase
MAADGQPIAPNVYDAEPIPEAARAEIDRLLASGDLFRYTAPEGAPVALLEQEFADLMGSKYALAVASCSAALFLSLKALDLPRGAKVLIPAFTFAAVPSAVVHADCVPVLVEVGENYRVDMTDFAAKLDDAQAVLISHMRGHTSDMDAIMALCDARGIPVVEDAAHSLGTEWHGRKIGTIGKIGCFSFQSYKLVNAGEGGILITDDPELAARCVIMSGAYESNWKKHPGMQNSYMLWQNKLPLYNMRMQNLSAAVIRPQLPLVADRVAKGRAGRCPERLRASDGAPCPCPRRPRARFHSVQSGGRLVRHPSAGLSGRGQETRRLGAGLWPVGGQCPRLLELGVPGPCPRIAPHSRHADAGLRCAPANAADRCRAGFHRCRHRGGCRQREVAARGINRGAACGFALAKGAVISYLTAI